MIKYVLDSSAILALVNLEPGSSVVEKNLSKSAVSSVNVSEVLSKLAERGVAVNTSTEEFRQLGLTVVDFDLAQAAKTAELRPQTKSLGLSLGDRACLALTIQQKAIALTADKSWKNVKVCKVELIR